MSELITPAQSELLVRIIAAVLTVAGAVFGWRTLGTRGISVGTVGPLFYLLWLFHKWITRYEAGTEYFGLDRVWVLSFEILLFICVGILLGFALRRTVRSE